MSKLFRRSLWLLVFLGLLPSVHAHALDEYVHATLVDIQPGEIRFEINLTPGVAVVDQVLKLIDTDGDGLISTNESVAYAELLKRDFTVRLDDQKVDLNLTALTFPKMADLRTGWGIIQMEFSATPKTLAVGSHRLAIEDRHLPAVSVYLLNAARPETNTIQITAQKRNENQSSGEIAFDFRPPSHPSKIFGVIISATVFGLIVAGICQARKQSKTSAL